MMRLVRPYATVVPIMVAAAFALAASFAVAGPSAAIGSAPDGAAADDAAPGDDAGAAVALDDVPLRAHADDVVDYTWRATLDPSAHTVHGEGTLRWRNTSSVAVHTLWLHLYLNAFKNERSAFLRERVGGRGSAKPEDWGWIDVRSLALEEPTGRTDVMAGLELHRPDDQDETDARLELPRDVAPGASIVLDVAFDDKLPSIVERTGYAGTFHMVGQWFPKVARLERDGTWAHFPFHHLAEFYADFGTYDVTLDVPASYVIGATGPTVEARTEHGRRVERHLQGDVHDFAWTAWDRWQVTEATIGGVLVRVLFPPGFEAVARRDLAAVRFALPYEGRLYGRYPYSVLTVVHPQEDAVEAGGMEYPTLITTEGAWWMPPNIHLPELVTIHELGHQWFYGLVATNEALWPFLDEGVNQYAEVDAAGRWLGTGSAGSALGFAVSDDAIQAVEGCMAVHDEPVAQPADAFFRGADYGRLVYSRTAAVLSTFARIYGADAVARALGTYTRRARFEHPGPDDFVATFADVLGTDAATTLRKALFDRGWVDFTVEDVRSHEVHSAAGVFDAGGKRTTSEERTEDAWEGSVRVVRRGTLAFPVDVDLLLADGSTRREHWDGVDASTRISWRGPAALRGAVVDPDDRVLVDQNVENNHASAEPARSAAPRTFERLTYFVELALQTLVP